MAIKHREIHGSRDGVDANDRSSETSLVYLLSGSNVIDDMRNYIDANALAPDTLDGLIYRSLNRERLGNRLWRWEVKYVEPDKADANNKAEVGGEILKSFDTTGGTAKIFVGRSTTSYGTNPKDHKGAINVTEDGAEGVEITVPMLKLQLKIRLPKATITDAYIRTLAGLSGTTNNATFHGYQAGELLFLGATGQQGTNTDPEITFHFLASKNLTGLQIGTITGIAKKGHEYLWVQFKWSFDSTAHAVVRVPEFVYVHQVYESADWSAMGL